MQQYDISNVLDLTGEQTNPPARPEKYKIKGGKVVVRDPKTIRGIVIHQTACMFGASEKAVLAAKGNKILARHRRALNVAAHVTAFTTGRAVYANPLPWYVYHGNGFNPYTYGLEIEGLYCGVEGDPRTVAGKTKDAIQLTALTIDAARTALTFIYAEGLKLGSPLEWVYAHRQSSSTRRSDPGQEIWQTVVLDYAVKVLGLKVNNDLVLSSSNKKDGPGLPIPMEWDPGAKARY